MTEEKIPTTIKIHPELLKEAKHFAIDKGMSLSELIEISLKKEMRK
jgi:hypothetical protein